MNPAEELGAQLISAKQRMEEMGGTSQILGYYRRVLFLQNYNGPEDYDIQYKTTDGTIESLPSYKSLLYVMRLKKVGDKVKAECNYIGDIYRCIETHNGKVLLKYFVGKGHITKITVNETGIKVRNMDIIPIHDKRLIDSLNDSLGKIGNTTSEKTNRVFLGVDTEDDI
jgi:hypothetical protein